MSAPLESVVRASARHQVALHRVTGGAWLALGALLLVPSIFVSGKPGEEALRVGAGVLGALLLASGAAYIHLMSGRVATLVELLLSRRTELRAPGITALRARGRIVAHEITVRDRSNRRYRMRVPSEADARAMLAGLGG